MSKTKKSHKSNDSNSSEETATSSTESEGELEKRDKKKRKQKDKKKHKKRKSSKKKSKHNSKSEKPDSTENSDYSTDASSSQEHKLKAKKKLKEEKEKSPVRVKRDTSRTRERDKQSGSSKWESSNRNERSRSRDRYRSERSRSRNRDRSIERSRSRYERSQVNRDNSDNRSNVKGERNDRRNYKPRDGDGQGGSYDRRDRSPKRERDRSKDRGRDRDYVKRQQRSPGRSRGSGNHLKKHRNNDDEGHSYDWGESSDSKKQDETAKDLKDREKPNFALSGALTEETNKVNGVIVKYAEPPEARKPKRRWRLYPFKGETALPVLHIHRQSCFLVGRERKVVDLAVDHPSCSKQHAALQYRLVPFERDNGTQGKRVRLYLIDLDSANGTFLNNKRVDARKYYELIEKDVVKFGFSTREYVLLHENSKEDQEDDDIEVKEESIDSNEII